VKHHKHPLKGEVVTVQQTCLKKEPSWCSSHWESECVDCCRQL